jgi:hypothetical protein
MAARQIPDGSWISPDGRWLWRDARWHPMPFAGQTGLFWFMSAPGWLPTLLILGLIGLIPFVGSMNIYGYAIVCARNLRAGYRVLPRANFSYLGLGAPVFVLGLAWSVITLSLMLAVGSAVGFTAYAQSHSLIWAIALAVPSGFTALGLASIPNLPLLIAALEMSDREGWGIFRIGKLVRHATHHWRAVWYGVGILLIWYLIYVGFAAVLSVVPGGSFLAAVAAVPVLAPMIAVPIARFDDPPARFTKGASNALAAGLLALLLVALAIPWGIGVAAALFLNAHQQEAACTFDPRCAYGYSGKLEAIAHVTRDSQDPTMVTLDVTYINRSASPASVDPTAYSVQTSADEVLLPSDDCPAPQPATAAPGERLAQRVCFRLPDATVRFEVHLPVIGWDYNTP